MSILIDKKTRLLIQGISGSHGLFHSQKMLEYGTNVVAGVTPGRGGEWVLEGKIPVFESAKIAVEATGANASLVFVPASSALDALYEIADAGISLIICITEGIPIWDVIQASAYLRQNGVRLIGPNSPGVITAGESLAGVIPGNICSAGNIGVVSRSGTLTYEVLYALKRYGLGISTCVGIGGDPIIGTNFVDILEMYEVDPHTEQVVLIGEIGGEEEEKAAEFILNEMTKPVVGYIAGLTAPVGKRMGHASAIIKKGLGKAAEKIDMLQNSGVQIADHPEEIPQLLFH